MQRILSRSTLTLTLTWTLTLTRMRCNRNQFQKELMRGLESTTGGMKAVELQAGLTVVIVLTMARRTLCQTNDGCTYDGYIAMATLTMAMLTCVPSSGTPPAPGLAPSLLATSPPTAYSLPPTHSPAGRQPRLTQRGQVEPLRGRRCGAGFLRGGRVLALRR